MSRFALTTIALVLAAGVAALAAGGRLRVELLGALAAVYLAVCGLGVAFIRMKFFCDAVCRGPSDGNRIALTLDDGPHPAVTPAVLAVLHQLQVPAAFFCIGQRVAEHPGIARQITADGHLIGNHSYRHTWWTNFLAGAALRRELERAQEAIQDATGVVPRYARPPMGLTNPHYNAAVSSIGLRLVGWDVRSLDTVCPASVAVARVIRLTRGGSILVLHDGCGDPVQVADAVRKIIEQLRARGFTFVRLDELLRDTGAPSPAH